MKQQKETIETFSIVSHSCYKDDPYRIYSECDSRDVEYMENNPSMYTLVKEGLTGEEAEKFIIEMLKGEQKSK